MGKSTATAQAPDVPKQERQRPVHEVRLGRIKAAIWANSTEQGVRYSTTLTRLYRDKEDGEWRTSTSFGRDDLLLVAQVCELAIVWICTPHHRASHLTNFGRAQDRLVANPKRCAN